VTPRWGFFFHGKGQEREGKVMATEGTHSVIGLLQDVSIFRRHSFSPDTATLKAINFADTTSYPADLRYLALPFL